jgi:transcriptional regulator with XRE-family HTH domain
MFLSVMDLRQFGRNLTGIRLKYLPGASFSDAAQRGRVTWNQLKKIEDGSMNPTLTTIFKLAESWGVPLEEFFAPEKEAEPSKTKARAGK